MTQRESDGAAVSSRRCEPNGNGDHLAGAGAESLLSGRDPHKLGALPRMATARIRSDLTGETIEQPVGRYRLAVSLVLRQSTPTPFGNRSNGKRRRYGDVGCTENRPDVPLIWD
jgi:hypothetical protein